MRRIEGHEIERRLAEDRVPSPPADLAARIKAEIPAELPSTFDGGETVRAFRARPGRRLLLAAAGVVIVVGSGLLTWEVLRSPSAGTTPRNAVAPAPPAPSASARTAGQKGDSRAGAVAPHPGQASAAYTTAQGTEQARTLTVTVTDEAGAPLAGATVAVGRAAAADAATRTTVTDARGVATFANLSVGTYKVTVALGLFKTVVEDSVVVGRDAVTAVALRMPAAVFAEKIEVTGATPGLPALQYGEQGAVGEVRRTDERKKEQVTVLDAAGGGPPLVMERSEGERATRVYRTARMSTPAPGTVPPSTGGTTEPNDRPYGDVFFRHYGVNPFVDTEDDALSTFGLDVDTGSYAVARRYLADGNLPDPASVRVEEYLNYFNYGDRPPRQGDFSITAEGAPTPFAKGDRYRVLRFGIRAREIDTAHRKPAVLTFVVDVSGSMAREDRLGLVKRALFALLDQLRPADEVALVVYGSRGRVLLDPTSDREAVRSAIDRLTPGGSTNAEEGLVLGYEVASRAFRRDVVNRVILCSDGVANVGRTGPDSILSRIEDEARRGIELTTVGFGMGNYNDVLLEQLADRGNGRYAYVDTFKEARRIFVENLTGTLQTIAVNARVQVEFDPKVVARYRLLGYENRDIADERFRDDTVDAGEIGAGHAVTALYEIKLRERPAGGRPVATLRLRYRPEAGGEFVEVTHEVRTGDIAPSWEKASPSLRLATLVAEFAEVLEGSYWARGESLDDVFRRAQQLSPLFPGDADVAELASLAGTAARLKAPVPTPFESPEEDAPPQRR